MRIALDLDCWCRRENVVVKATTIGQPISGIPLLFFLATYLKYTMGKFKWRTFQVKSSSVVSTGATILGASYAPCDTPYLISCGNSGDGVSQLLLSIYILR
jgi:hypothetical protein